MKLTPGRIQTVLFLVFLLSTTSLFAQTALTAHVREAVASGAAKPLGQLASTKTLSLNLVLPLRDEAALDAYLADLYDPSSPSYRHFLSVAEFTAQFGPTQADYNAVLQFAQKNGLTVTGGSRDGLNVQLQGSVAAIESAFHVNMRTYQHPTESRSFYAPDSEPVANMGVALWHISGLDNYATPKPRYVKRSEASTGLTAMATQATTLATTGSGPSASYLGSDMRAAYYGGSALTGSGQNAGLLEFGGTNLADLATYLKNTGQSNTVPITLLSVDGTSTSCNYASGCDDTEQILDITQILGMAPKLASLIVYTGSSDTAILAAMTSHTPLPTTIGCSWGWTPANPTVLDPYFKKMAAQGQSFFAASGNSATWSASNAAWPADDAYVTSVGGTDLVTASAAGAWQSETAWANSGGGIAPAKIAIPAWQQLSGVITTANKGSKVYRNGPDVAANANYTFYVCADQSGCTANQYGGTSFAAPMWAGYVALLNQQLAAAGNSPIGFLNPALYNLGVGATSKTVYHDITSGTAGSGSAATGYDLVTGWGSPNGTNLLSALAATVVSPTFTLTPATNSLPLNRGTKSALAVATTALNGFSSAVTLTASGLPAGVSVAAASVAAPGSGSAALTFSSTNAVAVGTYPLTLTATGGGTTKTAAVALAVTATPTFAFGVSTTAISAIQGVKTPVTLATAAINGFNSAVALSISSTLPTGITATFGTSTIAAPGTGSTTVNFLVAATVAAGSYPITFTAVGGGITQTAQLALIVVPAPSFTLTASANTLSIAQGSKASLTFTTACVSGFSASVALSATGLPTGVTSLFGPAIIASPGAGTAQMTLAVSNNLAIGTYAFTVTGAGGGVTRSIPMTLTVTAGTGFTLTPSQTALTITRGNAATITLSSTLTGSFSARVTLATANYISGVTATFGAAAFAAPGSGSTTVKISTSKISPLGTFTLNLSGTGGGMTKTTPIALTLQ